MKKNILLITLCILLLKPLFAQLDNTALRYNLEILADDTHKLKFSFNNVNFMRNTEYFNDIETGQTFFLYQLNPKLIYFPSEFMRIDGGIFLRKDFGNSQYTSIDPTFSLKLFKNGFSTTIGNLEGNLNHRLIEPLYHFDQVITNPLEQGLQMKLDKKKFWGDMWINWERMIYMGSPFQEQIAAGHSSLTTLFAHENGFKIQLPVQALVHHFGGQIDTTNDHIISKINTTAGLRFSYEFQNSFVKEIRSDNYFVYYKNFSPYKDTTQPAEGTGMYFNLLVKTKFIDIMFNYWNAENYIAPRGGHLYQSMSTDYPSNYISPKRELLFIRFMYEKQILPHLFLNARLEPYYDFHHRYTPQNPNVGKLEFSYSFYFVYRQDFSLWRVKK